MKYFFALLLALFLTPAASIAQNASDEEGVRRAILDYVEGFYEGDDEKLKRGVSPEVNKRGFYKRRGDDSGEYHISPMSYDEMFEYTARIRQSGNRAADDAVKIVQILDIMDQTASAKLTAFWGVDYLLLGRMEGEWKILQVLWQTPPPGDQ